jgi:hypothetical protein
MGANDLLQVLRKRPFEPFRLVLTNGQSYEVHHPDMALVTRGAVHVAVPSPASPNDPANEVVFLSLFHVMKVEFLSASTPTQP